MFRKLLIIYSLTVILISCNQTRRTDEKEINFIGDTIKELTTEPEGEFDELPLDILELKNLPFLGTTSGVVTVSKTEKFCRPDTAGFFGHYTLLNRTKSSDYEYIGYLIVYTTDKPENWRYENSNEIFIELKLESPDIKIYSNIGVGTTETELMKFLEGKKYIRQANEIIAEISSFTAKFDMKSDTVNILKIGKYCNKE